MWQCIVENIGNISPLPNYHHFWLNIQEYQDTHNWIISFNVFSSSSLTSYWNVEVECNSCTCLAGAGCIFQSGCCCCSAVCRHCLNRGTNRDKSEFPLELIFNTQQTPAVSSLAESFHDGVGVQHPPLDPVHCVLTALHGGGGGHGGVVLHQTSRRPRLLRDKTRRSRLSPSANPRQLLFLHHVK